MEYDAAAKARELFNVWLPGYFDAGGRDDLYEAVTAALTEAHQAGEARHVEHHRCERCYQAGVAQEREAWTVHRETRP